MTTAAQASAPSTTLTRLPLTPLALFASCLLSLAVILQNPLLNDDAYKYLRAAEIFNQDGAHAVFEAYEWFHYSILVALVDRVIPGDLVVAAHVLNTLLYALLTFAFLKLVAELRAGARVQLFAALSILALPLTNEMRYFLIRDTGFWAFGLLSLVYLVRFNRDGDVRYAASWSAALVAATVFRLEGLLLMALAPWFLLLPDAAVSLQQRAERCGRLVGVLAACLVSVLLIAWLAGFSIPELVAYAYRWYLPLLADINGVAGATAAKLGDALFTDDNFPGDENFGISLASALFGYLVTLLLNLVNALSIPLSLLLVFGRAALGPTALPRECMRPLQAYCSIAALALLLFLVIMQFLTQRYSTLLALLVLAQVPLLLDEMHARAQAAQRLRRFHGWMGFLLFYFAVDSLVSFGYSHSHIEDGIAWARTELPAGARLQTNQFAIAYRSGRIVEYDKISRDTVEVVANAASGDYLVLEVDHDSTLQFTELAPLTELERFSNERGDEVRVYRYD